MSATPSRRESAPSLACVHCLPRWLEKSPLILYIDDLHWGDLDSVQPLLDVLAGEDSPNLLFLATHRSEDDPGPMVPRLHEAGCEERLNLHHIELAELDTGDALALVDALVGRSQMPRAWAEAIVEEAGGNPFVIDVLARSTTDDATASALSLTRVFETRLQALSLDARRLLELIALAGQPIALRTVEHAAEIDGPLAALADLRAQRMVRVIGGKHGLVAPYHDRVREGVVAQLSETRLSTFHAALAHALSSQGGADDRIGLHFLRGGLFARAHHHLVRAAEDARHALAFTRAAELYALALEALEADAEATSEGLRTLRIKRADALSNAGKTLEPARMYDALANAAHPREERVFMCDMRRKSALLYLTGLHMREGLDAALEALRAVDVSLAPSVGRASISMGLRMLALQRHRLPALSDRATWRPDPQAIAQLDACLALAYPLFYFKPVEALDLWLQAHQLAVKLGDPRRTAMAQLGTALVEIVLPGVGEARALRRIERSIAILEAIGEPGEAAFAWSIRAMVGYGTSDYEGGLRAVERALVLCETPGQSAHWARLHTQQWAQQLRWYTGHWGDLVDDCRDYLPTYLERGDVSAYATLYRAWGWLREMLEDRADDAITWLEDWLESHTDNAFYIPHLGALFCLSQLDIYQGRGDRLYERLRSLDALIRESGILSAPAGCDELRSIYVFAHLGAAQTAAPHKATEHLREARRFAKQLRRKTRLSRWRALADAYLACVDLQQGRTRAALKKLRASEAWFERHRMTPYVMATQRARGLVLGGEMGDALVRQAHAYFEAQGAVRPEHVARSIIPVL